MAAKRDHTEPLVLDTLTIAEPSFKKSPVISLIKRPYIQFAHDWNENNKQDIYTVQAERKLLESKLEALEKKKDVTAEEIAELRTELSNMPPSNFRRIAVDDVTPESLLKPRFLISFHICSIGFISGVYGGIKISSIFSGILNEPDLCQAAPSHANMILSLGNVFDNSSKNTFIHSVLQYGITRKQLSPVSGSIAP